jgi:FKBP-type peptidyl-prolyl cis-trans isomerase SlyD
MIKNGSTVKMHYTLTVDGVILDQSAEGEPLVYTQGSGQIIPGLENQLSGLKKGDRKEVTVAPDQGYGMIDPNAYQTVAKTAFQNAPQLKVGDVVTGQLGEHPFQATVSNIGAEDITLDFNHPLAGKTLRFSIEVVDIV